MLQISQGLLMKIMRLHFRCADGQWSNSLRPQMHDIVLVLNDAGDDHKSLIQHGSPVLFVEIRHYDDVGVSGLILQGHEDQAVRCTRALAGYDRLFTAPISCLWG